MEATNNDRDGTAKPDVSGTRLPEGDKPGSGPPEGEAREDGFVGEDVLEEVRDDDALGEEILNIDEIATEAAESNAPGNAAPVVRVLSCPICARPMAETTVHETKVDVCEEHGVWLDKGELEAIVLRIKVKGLRRSHRGYEALKNRLEGERRGRTSGLLGVWLGLSLLPRS